MKLLVIAWVSVLALVAPTTSFAKSSGSGFDAVKCDAASLSTSELPNAQKQASKELDKLYGTFIVTFPGGALRGERALKHLSEGDSVKLKGVSAALWSAIQSVNQCTSNLSAETKSRIAPVASSVDVSTVSAQPAAIEAPLEVVRKPAATANPPAIANQQAQNLIFRAISAQAFGAH